VTGPTDLLSGRGGAVLAAAMTLTASGADGTGGDLDPLAAAAALARACPDASADLRAAALTQAGLRRHAAGRFGPEAALMLFTRDGLEQATRPSVAAHRAASLRERAGPDVRTALDLCCGVGSELIALARARFDVTGVDLDPEVLDAAAANLAALGLAGRLLAADATTVDTAAAGVVVADPARRGRAGRLRDPERFSPPWSWVRELLARPGVRACVTTSPALDARLVPPDCEAEWVDDTGSTVELAVWSPALSTDRVRRRATVLARPTATATAPATGIEAESGSGSTPGPATVAVDVTDDADLSLTDADDGARQTPAAADPEPGQWLLEPRGAVLRAGLIGVLADRVDGRVPAPGIGYLLTADPAPAAGLAAAFEIVEVVPLRPAVVRRRLAQLGAGSLEVLARGVVLDVAGFRSAVLPRRTGGVAVTLVATRTRTGAVALLVQRCAPAPAARRAGLILGTATPTTAPPTDRTEETA